MQKKSKPRAPPKIPPPGEDHLGILRAAKSEEGGPFVPQSVCTQTLAHFFFAGAFFAGQQHAHDPAFFFFATFTSRFASTGFAAGAALYSLAG